MGVSATRPALRTRLRRLFKEDTDVRRGLTVLAIATLTLLATVAAALQQDASLNFARAQREVERLSTEVTAEGLEGLSRSSVAYAGFRRWYEQSYRLRFASDRLGNDPGNANAKLWETLEKAETDIQTWTLGTSALLQPPYYEAKTFETDVYRFYQEQVAEPLQRVTQARDLEAGVAREWSGKSSNYVTILTLVAVGLFFLGLSTTLSARAGPAVALAGLAFGVFAAGWGWTVASDPVERAGSAVGERVAQAEAAVAALAAEREGAREITQEVRDRYQAAIAAVDQALVEAPGYLAGYRARGDARAFYAGDLLGVTGRTPETDALASAAADDYRRYLAANPGDYAAWGNLGYAEYLAEDQAAALDATDRAIALESDRFDLLANRATILLAMGDPAGVQDALDRGFAAAARRPRQSAVEEIGSYDAEFGRLARQRPREAEGLLAMQRRIREGVVALRVRASTRPAADAPALGDVALTTLRLLPDGTIVPGRTFAAAERVADPDAVGVRLSIAGPAAEGRTLSVRLYRDGLHDADYDQDVAWRPADGRQVLDLLSPYGRAGAILEHGAVEVELYLDGATRKQLAFTVLPPAPQVRITGADLAAALDELGVPCGDPGPKEDREEGSRGTQEIACQRAVEGEPASFYAVITTDDAGALTALYFDLARPDGGAREQSVRAFTDITERLYGPERKAEITAWLDRQTEDEFRQISIAGTWLGVSAEGDTRRTLYVNAE
jgi:hypothetical protein